MTTIGLPQVVNGAMQRAGHTPDLVCHFGVSVEWWLLEEWNRSLCRGQITSCKVWARSISSLNIHTDSRGGEPIQMVFPWETYGT